MQLIDARRAKLSRERDLTWTCQFYIEELRDLSVEGRSNVIAKLERMERGYARRREERRHYSETEHNQIVRLLRKERVALAAMTAQVAA